MHISDSRYCNVIRLHPIHLMVFDVFWLEADTKDDELLSHGSEVIPMTHKGIPEIFEA